MNCQTTKKTTKNTTTMAPTTRPTVRTSQTKMSTSETPNPIDNLVKNYALINETFRFCSVDLEKNLLNFNTMCMEEKNTNTSTLEKYLKDAQMPITKDGEIRFRMYKYGKMHYEVYGSGIQWTVKRHILKSSMNFLGMKFKTSHLKQKLLELHTMNVLL